MRSIAVCLCLFFLIGGATHATAASQKEKAEKKPVPKAGIWLGDFFLREARVAQGSKVRLSFTLYAEVDAEYEDLFNQYAEIYRHRLSDQVITALRIAKISDLREPELHRLRRLILLRLRRMGFPPMVEKLMITEFEYFNE